VCFEPLLSNSSGIGLIKESFSLFSILKRKNNHLNRLVLDSSLIARFKNKIACKINEFTTDATDEAD
jgi:hypothetical protein